MSKNTCQGCDWAMEASGGSQNGCHANRLIKFKERGEATRNSDTGYYNLSRVCTLKRENFEGTLEDAIFQIGPLFGIVIEDDGDCDWEDICAAADQVINQDYSRKKISVILSTNMDRGIKNIVMLTEKIKAEGFQHFKSVIHAVDAKLQVKELDQWRPIASATYFVKVRPEERPIIDNNFLSGVRDRIVDNLEKLMIEDWTGVTVVSASLVKGLYMNFNSYEKTVDSIRGLTSEGNISEWPQGENE
ncbi:hypothetical protein OAK92_01025 [Crocinitomicaceae bacterium]|nr:hypothetical protein [Crocinitomicaceae bacterium]